MDELLLVLIIVSLVYRNKHCLITHALPFQLPNDNRAFECMAFFSPALWLYVCGWDMKFMRKMITIQANAWQIYFRCLWAREVRSLRNWMTFFFGIYSRLNCCNLRGFLYSSDLRNLIFFYCWICWNSFFVGFSQRMKFNAKMTMWCMAQSEKKTTEFQTKPKKKCSCTFWLFPHKNMWMSAHKP